jgi:geranylgeranyl pyrophosphate synthase
MRPTVAPRPGPDPGILSLQPGGGLGPCGRFAARVLPTFEETLGTTMEVPAGLPRVFSSALRSALGIDTVPGSRWRPLLTLATTEAVGGTWEDALNAAVAIELTHTASLVLDDLPCMDDAKERRGLAATHRQIGMEGAILLALALLARSAELLGQSGPAGGQLSASWGRAFGLMGMSGGQAMDLTGGFATGGAPRRLHREKTTALSALAVEAGARIGGTSAATESALVRFGRDLGWAYQLADDAQDWREDGRLGRQAGGRDPRRQSERLLGRALRHLDDAPDLTRAGRELLESMARKAAGFPNSAQAPHWG